MKPFVRRSLSAGSALALGLVGCKVGPDYQRPSVDSPNAYRTATSDTLPRTGANSLSDLGWAQVFDEPQLQAYLAEALTNSWDIKIAAARVLQAEAAARVTRSQFFPTINAGGDIQTTRFSKSGSFPLPAGVDPQREFGEVFLSMPGYELDLWGRIRRANEAARAQILASVEAQRTVRQTLVAQTATAYYELLELDLELDISKRSYQSRTNSLDLTRSRQEGGVAALQDVYQSEILVHTAEAAIVDTLRRIEQQENLLAILLGRNPGGIQRGAPLTSQLVRAEIPVGLPSALLERRPDIRNAEQQLVAANAEIGQARAAFFPQISLTGFYGYQSASLSDLFSAPARVWQFGPSVTVPLFTGGRLRGNLQQAKARFEEAVARYQQTVQGAFREVSDALIAYKRLRELREKIEARVKSHRGATALAADRYEGGVTSYLEVLYNEQELFNAELSLAQTRRDEFLSVVQLYQALGGGAGTATLPPQPKKVPHKE